MASDGYRCTALTPSEPPTLAVGACGGGAWAGVVHFTSRPSGTAAPIDGQRRRRAPPPLSTLGCPYEARPQRTMDHGGRRAAPAASANARRASPAIALQRKKQGARRRQPPCRTQGAWADGVCVCGRPPCGGASPALVREQKLRRKVAIKSKYQRVLKKESGLLQVPASVARVRAGAPAPGRSRPGRLLNAPTPRGCPSHLCPAGAPAGAARSRRQRRRRRRRRRRGGQRGRERRLGRGKANEAGVAAAAAAGQGAAGRAGAGGQGARRRQAAKAAQAGPVHAREARVRGAAGAARGRAPGAAPTAYPGRSRSGLGRLMSPYAPPPASRVRPPLDRSASGSGRSRRRHGKSTTRSGPRRGRW